MLRDFERNLVFIFVCFKLFAVCYLLNYLVAMNICKHQEQIDSLAKYTLRLSGLLSYQAEGEGFHALRSTCYLRPGPQSGGGGKGGICPPPREFLANAVKYFILAGN